MSGAELSVPRKRRAVRALPEGFVFRAAGRSMLPAVRPGDALRVERAAPYRRGDVLLFEQGGRLLAHRLVGERGEGRDRRLILRGDSLRHSDPPVPPEAVLGRVRSIERGGRTIAVDGLRDGFYRLLARASVFGVPLIPLLAAARRRLRSIAAPAS